MFYGKKLLILTFIFVMIISVQVSADSDNMVYLVDRAVEWNIQQVIHDSQLSYPAHVAGEEEIQKRVTLVHNYTEKLNDTEYSSWTLFLDVYSIIEHETRWVNYLYLDEGTSFGIGSMQFSTAKMYVDKPNYILQSDTELQIKLAVKYYIFMVNHTNCRHKAIVGYNRGHEVDNPYQYNYFEKVIEIRKEVKKELTKGG